jgi:hypothetical protein
VISKYCGNNNIIIVMFIRQTKFKFSLIQDLLDGGNLSIAISYNEKKIRMFDEVEEFQGGKEVTENILYLHC